MMADMNVLLKKKTKIRYSILLSVIILAMLFLNTIWHLENDLPQGKDTFSHLNKLNIAGKLLRMEKHHYYYKYDRSYIHNLIFIVYDYPFFYYYISLFFYLLLFPLIGFKAVFASSTLFSLLLVFFTYKIAKLLINKKCAVFAAFICAFAPFNITNSRSFNLEIALIATITMSFYFFLRSRFFIKRKYVVFCALTCSASMLTRATAVIPLMAMFIWFLSKSYDDYLGEKARWSIKRKNLFIFLMVFLPLTMIYYANPDVIQNHIMRSFSIANSPTNLLYRIGFYAKGIFAQGLGGNYLFALLFTFLLIKSSKLVRLATFFLVFIPVFFIMLLPKNLNEELEWILLVLPLMVVVISSVMNLENKIVRSALATFIFLLITAQCFSLSFLEKQSLTPFLRTLFTGKILSAQKCPAYRQLLDDLSMERTQKLDIAMIANTQGLHFIPIFSAAVDLHKRKWKLTELTSFKQKIDVFDYFIVVTEDKNFEPSERESKLSSKLILPGQRYAFKSNYFEFSEYVFLYKTKK
jgi:4-amino-4-deoxy-L-arabinose transferase-like glycosyltransferase